MAGVKYDKVWIYFPVEPKKAAFHSRYPESVHGNKLHFTERGLHITARIQPYHLPPNLTNGWQVEQQIIRPGKDLVLEDLASSFDLFDQLQLLAQDRRTNTSLEYDKLTMGNPSYPFHVFDFSFEEGRLFRKLALLLNLKEAPSGENCNELIRLAALVKQDDEKTYVQGKTVKGALETAIAIYKLDGEIRRIAT